MYGENPAVILYQHYRNLIRWRGESYVEKMRKDWVSKVPTAKNGLTHTDLEIEQMSRISPSYARYRATDLNYRMSLMTIAITSCHLDEPRLFPDLDDWEPVISLCMRGNGTMSPMFTIWPDGRFLFVESPSTYFQVLPEFVTFLGTAYAAGRRVWMVRPQDNRRHAWIHLDEKDYTNPVPYVRNYDLITSSMYRLVPGENGFWKFDGIDMPTEQAVGNAMILGNTKHQELLTRGYQVAEQRYARYRRVAERDTTQEKKRNMVAMYVPRHGIVTEDEAVSRFTQSMRVYEPASRP